MRRAGATTLLFRKNWQELLSPPGALRVPGACGDVFVQLLSRSHPTLRPLVWPTGEEPLIAPSESAYWVGARLWPAHPRITHEIDLIVAL
jgi:hypothetical protein